MNWKYPLASTTWNEAEFDAINQVIQSGQFSMGKQVMAFEKAFSEYLNSKYVVMCSSGSSANLIMTAALFYKKENPLKAGDEIIVPAVSWSTTFFPLYQYGLKLKFVDIDADTLNYDLVALASAIGPKTRAIMTVNLLGNPNDFNAIRRMIGNRQIYLIEDNCESLGATFENRQAGTFGLMGTYSSFYSHHIATMEGGAVATDDEELYHILLCLRAHGWTRNLPKENKVTGVKSDDPFEESFKFVLPGYNVRPLEMSGAIGVRQIEKLPAMIEARRNNALIYQELFGNDPRFRIQKETSKSSWFGFSFVLNPELPVKRKEFANKLLEMGVECRPIVAGNFAKNQALKWFDYEIHSKLDNADLIDTCGIFVGNHHFPIMNELQELRKMFDTILKN
jgi:CDP-6-deoxy-D-xylo-4-hexulose-3-dehydrase